MRELSLFLGCVAPNRYPGIEVAAKKVFSTLGVDLADLDGASCCPAPGVFRSLDKLTWLTLASRNITLSEKKSDDILTICNGCFSTLKDANDMLKEDPALKKDVNSKLAEIGHEFRGTQDVRHVVEYLYQEIGVDKVREAVTKPLHLRVAVHYGCHLIHPLKDSKLGLAGKPTFFDELVEATGATSVDYEDKMSCCGAGGGARTAILDATLKIANKKLEHMTEAGADCIVDACPFCHLQFDAGQAEINQKFAKNYNLPVLHYTQLLGLAMGFSPEELGIAMNTVDTSRFIEKVKMDTSGNEVCTIV
ncbi:CoB--CoM heterodisulfide reductase subunit B [Methanolobus sp.]|uniref:CoB--CoM heterodisulfide reductase subunit B n=1 Tax=Methanolobus sp. TaxID=1874737 RepID=UPI0025CE6A33|nr:CoB--CoM heterodisulfide reductase subunit B [Methanolobus sp.]